MTAEQRQMVETLNEQVTFLPGSFDKRFVRTLADYLKPGHAKHGQPLTEAQANLLLVMFHRYRRQHWQCRCEVCQAGNGGAA